MTTNTLKENWGVFKANLKEKYAGLTDNDLAYIHGREEDMFGRIEEKTGASREELLRILRSECGCNC